MPTYVKLTDAGASIIRRIEAVKLDTSGAYPDLHLVAGDEVIVIPKNAADRQLERIKIASEAELVGMWVKVSRSDKPGKNGKLFWNLNIEAAPPPESGERMPSPYAKPSRDVPPPPRFDDVPLPPDPEGDAPVSAPAPAAGSPAPAPTDPSKAARAAQMRDAFLTLWEEVATVQVATGKRMGFAVDGASVNAATATVWISMKDRGLI